MNDSVYTPERIKEFLIAANSDLGSGKYTGAEMIPDYCMAVKIGQQLQAALDKAKGLLQDALPNIECKHANQSGLITEIGIFLQDLPEGE